MIRFEIPVEFEQPWKQRQDEREGYLSTCKLSLSFESFKEITDQI